MDARVFPPVVHRPEPPRRRFRVRHAGALIAAAAYGGAGFGVYHLANDVRQAGTPEVAGEVEGATAALAAPPATAGGELLAMRALAARAQRSVYAVEASGTGSGFVAWVQEGRRRSFVITAREVVAGLLADGGRALYVRDGDRLWPARLVQADRRSGLALVRVDAILDRPLWQVRIDRDPLEPGAHALVVPAGEGAALGEGRLAAAGGAFHLDAGSGPLHLGAPVLSEEGRLAGVVVARRPGGVSRVVPIDAACGQIRRC